MEATVDVRVESAFLVDLERRREELWLAEAHLVDELSTWSAHLNAATAQLVELVWQHRQRFGADVAGFVAFKCGITGQEAAEYVRVAEALQELPVTRAAFARGEITFAKVRALTRVATASSETGLLELAATLTASQLQRALRAYHRVTVEEARQTHELEYVSYWFADDGSLMLRARLAAEDGTVIVKALDAAHDRILQQRRREHAAAAAAAAEGHPVVDRYGPADPVLGPSRPARVEALLDLMHAKPAPSGNLGEPGNLGDPGDPGERGAPMTARLVVHVDAATLTGHGEGRSELADGPVISPETARRLGCDAEIVAQIERDGLPLTVGRTRRTVPAGIRRLLDARDQTSCRFPGCERRRHLQAHHRHHWAHGGHTSLSNLVLLCYHHHRHVHEGGYTIEDDPAGGLLFRNPRGLACSNVPSRPPPGSADHLTTRHRQLGLEITPTTNRHGGGSFDPFDLDLTVSAIASIINRTTAPDPAGHTESHVTRSWAGGSASASVALGPDRGETWARQKEASDSDAD